jgi:hypothetical protein
MKLIGCYICYLSASLVSSFVQQRPAKYATFLPMATNPIQLPENEFSRTLRTEIILGPRRREYEYQISANEEELESLAKRFKLSKISKLEADLVLRRDRNNSSPGTECIQVEGSITAAVTQTCVRTNEDFDVDLEFNFLNIVRSTGNGMADADLNLGGMNLAQIQGSLGGSGQRSNNKKKRRKQLNLNNEGASLDDKTMGEIGSFMQELEVEDDVIEDVLIFGNDGILDVGELVAQSFRLKLDPYPKKPGSEPVKYSITG